MPVHVAIVEDDPRVRRTLARILNRAGDCCCVGEYGAAEEALDDLPRRNPQVVLMDIDLPGMSGVECVRRLVEKAPATQVLMLTVFSDADTIFEALAAGAVGYLVKPIRAEQLVDAVRDVFGGGAPMTSGIARKVVQLFQRARGAENEASRLSPREQEVLELLAQGYLYKEIADRLDIRYATIRTHIERIYQKLHVRSRTEAVARYLGRAARERRR
ncbi:MAG: response regulator transcription factor [Verrucomicrobiae bacterium]|nr:response regulator transcription factor [Verrucomicrobiae bacterium]